MPMLATDCPQCGLALAPMEILTARPDRDKANDVHIWLQCPRCREPICGTVRCTKAKAGQATHHSVYGEPAIKREAIPQQGDILLQDWIIIKIWPKPPEPLIPAYLPAEVARPYLAAESNFPQQGMEEAAAGSYGRALDVGTKLFVPQHAGQKLNNRIDKMRKEGLITQSLWEWAHLIKSIRNDALHDVESIDREELKAIRGFTETLLTYLFTLPGMLSERKAAAEAGLSQPAPGEGAGAAE